MTNMSREQFESAYYAWYRANAMYQAFDQLWEPVAIKSYHDILSEPFGPFLYTWQGLLFALLEFLKKFDDGIPLAIRSEVDLFFHPLRRFRNAIFHIQNHPFSEKQDEILKLRPAINRVVRIHHEIGKYLCAYNGWPYPPYLPPTSSSAATRGFAVPIVATATNKMNSATKSESSEL